MEFPDPVISVALEPKSTEDESKMGIGVAVVEGDRCSECRLSIPTQLLEKLKSTDEFVYCNSCRRILLRGTLR